MRLNYRNTREILAFAYQFAADVLGAADSDDDHIPLLLPESAGNHGPEPKVVRLSAWADELAYTVSALKSWHEQGLAWNEMAVLYANKFQGGALARVLKEAGIPAYWLGTSEYKKGLRSIERSGCDYGDSLEQRVGVSSSDCYWC